MSTSEVERNEAYFASRVDTAEIDRLTVHARLRDPHVRDGLRRIGIGVGQKAIDVGCGPLGALLVLADVVGPTGAVVGLDMDSPSLERAGAILRQHGHDRVRLVHANIDTLSAAVVCPPGPFDVAVCSQFLNNQPDPVYTLRRIATIVRSGGHLLVQSPASLIAILDRSRKFPQWTQSCSGNSCGGGEPRLMLPETTPDYVRPPA